jgi:peptidoglycan/LPS O-acetylase OafA/YrhL
MRMNQQSSNLDLLRATAVLLVVASHLLDALAPGHPVLKTTGLVGAIPGHLGVWMFFIHTSLVLMMSLERLSATGGRVAARFYIRRLFRIYPLSIFTVVTVLALRIPPFFEPTFFWPTTKAIIVNLLLVQNVYTFTQITGPLWSLPYEVQMYLLLPLLYLAARRIRSYRGVCLLIASGFVLYRAELHLAHWLGYPPLFTYAPWFAMGTACYAISRMRSPSIPSKWYPVCLAGLVLSVVAAHGILQGNHEGWTIWGFGLLFALALPHFRNITSQWVRAAAHYIATYSYGIYLCHVPVLWFAFQKLSGQPEVVQVLVCTVLLVAVPVMLFHWLESPMIGVGAKLARSLEAKPVLVQTAGSQE